MTKIAIGISPCLSASANCNMYPGFCNSFRLRPKPTMSNHRMFSTGQANFHLAGPIIHTNLVSFTVALSLSRTSYLDVSPKPCSSRHHCLERSRLFSCLVSETSATTFTTPNGASASLISGDPKDWVNVNYVILQAAKGQSRSDTVDARGTVVRNAGSSAGKGPWSKHVLHIVAASILTIR